MDRWINWSQRTPEQKINVNIKNELEKIINTNTNQNVNEQKISFYLFDRKLILFLCRISRLI